MGWLVSEAACGSKHRGPCLIPDPPDLVHLLCRQVYEGVSNIPLSTELGPLSLEHRTNVLIMRLGCIDKSPFPVEDEPVGLDLNQLVSGSLKNQQRCGGGPGRMLMDGPPIGPGPLDVLDLALKCRNHLASWVTILDGQPVKAECGSLPLLERLKLDSKHGLNDGGPRIARGLSQGHSLWFFLNS